MKESMFQKVLKIRKGFGYENQSDLIFKQDGFTLLTTDINKVESRKKMLSKQKALAFVASVNYHNSKNGIEDRITLEDVFNQDEKSELLKAKNIVSALFTIIEDGEMEKDEKELRISKQLKLLESILEHCYYSTSLLINVELGKFYFKINNFFLAKKHLEKHLDFFIKVKDYDVISKSSRIISFINIQMNMLDESIILFEKIKFLIEELDDRDGIRLNFAVAFVKKQNPSKSLELLNSIELDKEDYLRADVLVEKAWCHYYLGEVAETEKIYKTMTETGNEEERKWGLNNLGELYMMQDRKQDLLEIFPDIEYNSIYAPVIEEDTLDYRMRIGKIEDYIAICFYLNKTNNLSKAVLKMMEIDINKKSHILEREKIIKIFLINATIQEHDIVAMCIKYIEKNSQFFNMDNFLKHITKYYLKYDLIKELKTFYIDIN